jgi:polyhydroxyalkanoate synthesis regulator phasin
LEKEMGKEKRAMPEALERLWSQALIAVSTAEEEAVKLAQRVSEAVGGTPEEMRNRAKELAERLSAQKRELERSVEETVKRTLQRVKVPRREELLEVQARLDRLTERVERLAR